MKRIRLFMSVMVQLAVMLRRGSEITRISREHLQENLVDIYDGKRDIMLSIYVNYDFKANEFVCECTRIINEPVQERRRG